MACVPCLVAPIIYGSGLLTFLNKNKIVITISLIILLISIFIYMKYRICKSCQKK